MLFSLKYFKKVLNEFPIFLNKFSLTMKELHLYALLRFITLKYENLFLFWIGNLVLNQTCSFSEQCTGSPYSSCLGGKCSCIEGYTAKNVTSCIQSMLLYVFVFILWLFYGNKCSLSLILFHEKNIHWNKRVLIVLLMLLKRSDTRYACSLRNIIVVTSVYFIFIYQIYCLFHYQHLVLLQVRQAYFQSHNIMVIDHKFQK